MLFPKGQATERAMRREFGPAVPSMPYQRQQLNSIQSSSS
jgi:hypothetical protein